MKVTASNQTVLLARDRVESDAPSPEFAHPGGSQGAGRPVLERLTIVTARPDSVVYVRADYASPASTFDGSVVATVPKRSAPTPAPAPASTPAASEYAPVGAIATAGARMTVTAAGGTASDIDGNPRAARSGGLSSYLRPAEQYALTQRTTGAQRARSRIDVHA